MTTFRCYLNVLNCLKLGPADQVETISNNPNKIKLKLFSIDLVDYAAIVFERCDNEVTEYYQPVDLEVGGTVFVYGRRFLLLDCDAFTRKYYREVLRKPQGNKLEVQLPQPGKPTPVIIVIMFHELE